MVIQIKTKQVGIPVTIGKLEFLVDTSDDGINNLADKYKEVVDLLEGAEEGDTVEQAKSILEEGFDLFLGAGAFEKIYEQTPSSLLCAEYLAALMEGVAEEMKKQQVESSKKINKKYLTKK